MLDTCPDTTMIKESRNMKFKYTFKHRKTGKIKTNIVTLEMLEQSNSARPWIKSAWLDDGWDIVDRALYEGKEDGQ